MLRLVFSFLSESVGERSAILKFVPALLSLTNLAIMVPLAASVSYRSSPSRPAEAATAGCTGTRGPVIIQAR